MLDVRQCCCGAICVLIFVKVIGLSLISLVAYNRFSIINSFVNRVKAFSNDNFFYLSKITE